jgi:hypothetical protein
MQRHLLLLAAAVALTTSACPSRERNPEGAVKAFLQAVEIGRLKKVYEMLDPGSQKRLKDLAQQAEDQTGGRRKARPEEMLVAGMAKARFRPGEMKTVSQGAQVAKVRVQSAGDKKHHEVFTLSRHDGRWRMVLPTRVLEEMLRSTKGRDDRANDPNPASRPTGR